MSNRLRLRQRRHRHRGGQDNTCHGERSDDFQQGIAQIAMVGQPNVGKSALFHRLTGKRVAVSNYPGTTVEVTRGTALALTQTVLIDTPGVITFPPHSEDESVTARVLLNEPLKAVLQVGDAKNLRRTLLLSIQLAEMGLPMVLALNMTDEAQARGVMAHHARLAEILSVPVVATTAVRGWGIEALIDALNHITPAHFRLRYDDQVEAALSQVVQCMGQSGVSGTRVSMRALALQWLSQDSVCEDWLRAQMDVLSYTNLVEQRQRLSAHRTASFADAIQATRLTFIDDIIQDVLEQDGTGWRGLSVELGHLATHPILGVLILVLVLYLLYWFVGVFGAGTLVGLLEEGLFARHINPWVVEQVRRLIPIELIADFLVGKYGLWTMGMTYAFALILPIVTTFFLAFGVLEDSGYLPRLAALSNRIFQSLGLNGKAVLPMVLGLGCVTMATLTTRVLESKRERLLVTLLLALAIPCSAQLGVVMGMLASISLGATLIWGAVVFLVLLGVGWLAARLMPGARNPLLVELPPLRWPMLSNVLLKTLARLEWYLKEVVPLFLIGAALMFVLDATGILAVLIRLGEPVVTGWLGLPPQASAAFLMGFLRRDFGATGLFLMQSQGLLSPIQVIVAMVTITLFIPCIASVMMIARERNWRIALGMIAFIIPLALFVGGVLNRILLFAGWGG